MSTSSSRSARVIRVLVVVLLTISGWLLVTPTRAAATTPLEQSVASWAAGRVGSVSYRYLCLKFVYDAYTSSGVSRGSLDAQAGYVANQNSYPVDEWDYWMNVRRPDGTLHVGYDAAPPVGAIIYYSNRLGHDYSHATISVGGGQQISPDTDAVNGPQSVNTNSYRTMLGWWLPDGGSAVPSGPVSITVGNDNGQMTVRLANFPLGTGHFFCHTGDPSTFPTGGSVTNSGAVSITSPDQYWAAGWCSGGGNYWVGVQAPNGQDYYSNQVTLGAPPPDVCEFNDAGNGSVIKAAKGSTFTDSLGNTWLVGQDCSLTLVSSPPPPPPPVPSCEITGFTPRSAVMGVTDIKVPTSITTRGCTLSSWRLSADDGEMFVTRDTNRTAVIRASSVPLALAGHPVAVEAKAVNPAGAETYRLFLKAFTVKRQTVWQSGSFNASPEPVKKGRPITVKGRAIAASWSRKPSWVAVKTATVSVQFRSPKGTYKTVKTVKTNSNGWASTSVVAKKSGDWRLVFSGSATLAGSASAADYVRVR